MAEMLVRVDDITDELLRQLQHAKKHKAAALIGELEHRIAARIEEQWMEPADKPKVCTKEIWMGGHDDGHQD